MCLVRLKLLPVVLSAILAGSGCDDGDSVDELIDDLFEDRSYAQEVQWPSQINDQCPAWSRRQTVVVDTSMTLPENCVFEQVTVQLAAPDIVFDCNNAVFNGMTKINRNEYRDAYSVEEAPQGLAFAVSSSENAAVHLSNITIRNCQILNYITALDIKVNLTDDTKQALRSGSGDEDNLRAKAPANVKILNSKIINSHGSGIYVNRYVTGFEMSNSRLKGSGGPGLYLDAGTRAAEVSGSVVEGNGYFSYNPEDRTREARRSDLAKREGIAIDSSTRNTISNSVFNDNANGGIYLYKNCWEDAAADPDELPRTEGADFNLIQGNRFSNELVGVWIAERADRDLSGFDCGDPVVYENDGEKYYRDYARENSVSGNTFTDNRVAVRVKDDANILRDNTFVNSERYDIAVGSEIREKIGDPVSGTLLSGNVLSKTDGINFSNSAD
ncbi:MAG: right-handed parallel beta-helix repeat-containing protein [Thiolinea sp.]